MTVASAAPAPPPPRLEIHGLKVQLPNGEILIEDLTLAVRPGEVVVLLGGSGSGKSTFSRVLFEREQLEDEGFELSAQRIVLERGELGMVPQRGALFDHLDVRGNIDLALRYAAAPDGEGGSAEDAETWLARVGLDRGLAAPGVPVSSLSGGQAQRVAVARALAGKRRVLFLDEPSVGLDPARVRMLARLVREQCEKLGVAAVVVTHDVPLAAGLGDRLYVIDPRSKKLELLFDGEWQGPVERAGVSEETRGTWIVRLEKELIDRIEKGEAGGKARGAELAPNVVLRAASAVVGPFGTAASTLSHLPAQLMQRPRDFAAIAWRVLRQTVVRPLPFYLIVSALIGYTVLYVISKVGGAGVQAGAGVRIVGGSYIVALAPVLSAVLYVAASGNATNAWLGSMGLTRQTLAMEALGVKSRAYLWAPTWFALGAGYLMVAALFVGGMLLGGLALCRQYHVTGAWELLTADFVDPRPERVRYLVRALFLIWVYAWGIATDVVAKGGAEKRRADDVTRGMTASVVACTLWVVIWELGSAVVVFGS